MTVIFKNQTDPEMDLIEDQISKEVTPISTFGKKGQIVHSQAREIIANVINFMKMEANNFQCNREPIIKVTNVKQRVMAATGISEKLYKTIMKESKEVDSGTSTSFSTPRKKKQCRRKKYELVEGEKHAIRTIIREFHLTEKKFPTVKGKQYLTHVY